MDAEADSDVENDQGETEWWKNAKKLFATSEKFENYNWRDTYSDSFFNVHVKVNVKSASLISNS